MIDKNNGMYGKKHSLETRKKMSENKKKYGLHCFGCGQLFYNKEEVYRDTSGFPICGECLADMASAEHDRFEEEQWYRNNPGKDPEEEHRKQVYIAKYGEY